VREGSIEVPVRPYATNFGEPYYILDTNSPQFSRLDPNRSLPKLEYGQTYEFRGYETGEFVGAPNEAAWDGGVFRQDAGFCFESEFVVVKGKKLAQGEVKRKEGDKVQEQKR
jgi:hypothetical protein